MSKLDLRLSYKNACILKHKLRNYITETERFIEINENGYTEEGLKQVRKDLKEEKIALAAITEEIDMQMYKHNRSCKKKQKANNCQ